MSWRKITSMVAVSAAILSLSQAADAGLFDDLQKMQQQMQQMQGGKMPQAPSGGGNAAGLGGMSTMGGGATGGGICGDAASKETVDCVCRSSWRQGQVNPSKVFKKLPAANIQVLAGDFSIAPDKINTELAQPLTASEQNAEVANLDLYLNAFETGAIAYLYSEFLETTGNKAAYLSILKQVADSNSGFDTKKKALKRDAMQAYGIVLQHFQSRGAKGNTGLKYLEGSMKVGERKDAMIATYQLGHRASFGIGQKRDLTKAVSFMLLSYQNVMDRKNKDMAAQTAIPLSESFITLVNDEFLSLVADPNYKRRQMYLERIQDAQRVQADMMRSLQDAKGRSPQVLAITKAYLRKESEINAKILRAIGQEERATIEEQRVQKFASDMSKDAQKYKDYAYQSTETRQFLKTSLAKVNTLDGKQKEKFSNAMAELALLTIEMDRISRSLLSQFANGQLDMMQINVAAPILTSSRVTCKLYDQLNNVGKKVGAPKAEVKFNASAKNTVINAANNDD